MEKIKILSVNITKSNNDDIIAVSCVAKMSSNDKEIIGEMSVGTNLHVCILEKGNETLFIIDCKQISLNMVGKDFAIINVIHSKEYIEKLLMVKNII